MKNVLHFTIGPVQSFVSQSRRTRDLWAGSFLLSWLSAHAMKSVLDHGGEIIFPKVTEKSGILDSLLRAVNGDFSGGNYPLIGSIPNRFKADVSDGFAPEQVEDTVIEQWKKLADAVFEQFVEPVIRGSERAGMVTAIWNRQINHFWEVNWVLGEPPKAPGEDARWLDRRKYWRNHWPQPEGGDHCTVMGDYQELSGFVRSQASKEQDEFWDSIRNSAPNDYLDIRENERLCAMALIKRLFPRLGNDRLKETIGWIPGGCGEAVGNWPSTTYMAVSSWLADINGHSNKTQLLEEYVCSIYREVGNGYFRKLASERATRLAFLDKLNAISLSCAGGGLRISDIDGDLLHLHALKNHRTTYLSDRPLNGSGKDADEEKRTKLIGLLQQLYRDTSSKPRSYYALLLMDGDHLGRLLRNHDQEKVSEALLDFTHKVLPCVELDKAHSGVTIYAGGDDVFALLPQDKAISCAQALRDIYGKCFADNGIEDATASCAIVFAHHQVPLAQVTQEAHRQLKQIAKEENGRDSLALAVLKPGGITAQWVSVWSNGFSPVNKLQALVTDVGKYPRGFFHKLRDRYGFYGEKDADHVPGGTDIGKILVAEYMQTRDSSITLERAKQAAELLRSVCQPIRRDAGGRCKTSATLKLGGAFIARFLTQEED